MQEKEVASESSDAERHGGRRSHDGSGAGWCTGRENQTGTGKYHHICSAEYQGLLGRSSQVLVPPKTDKDVGRE